MLFDLHNDYLTACEKERNNLDFNATEMSVVFAVWASKLAIDTAEYFEFIKQVPEKKNLKCLTAIEDISGIEIADYDEFFAVSQPAYVSLTWNGENELAGGVGSDGRLTMKGKSVLRAMERSGIPLDLSHLNEESFWDTLDYFDGKVMLSHTALKRGFPCARNSSEAQLHAIHQHNGIVGIFAAANFLSAGKCHRSDLVNHIIIAINQTDINHIALGTDFCGAEHYPDGFSGYSDIFALRDDLAGHGFTDNDIDKIFYKNAERFFGD